MFRGECACFGETAPVVSYSALYGGCDIVPNGKGSSDTKGAARNKRRGDCDYDQENARLIVPSAFTATHFQRTLNYIKSRAGKVTEIMSKKRYFNCFVRRITFFRER